jgi:hypothetical protein
VGLKFLGIKGASLEYFCLMIVMADRIFQDKYEQYCQVSGGVDARDNINKEMDKAQATFEGMRKVEWLEWAGKVLKWNFPLVYFKLR